MYNVFTFSLLYSKEVTVDFLRSYLHGLGSAQIFCAIVVFHKFCRSVVKKQSSQSGICQCVQTVTSELNNF